MSSCRIAGTKYLVCDPQIMGGIPVVAGTRFPVAMVVTYCVRDGYTPRSIVLEWNYPKRYIERFEEALEWGKRNK